jgi:hypothetical protein
MIQQNKDSVYTIYTAVHDVLYTASGADDIAAIIKDVWVVWEWGKDSESHRKIPVKRDGKYVRTEDKNKPLMTIAEARAMLRKGKYGGLGVYMRAPIFGIDFDDVVTRDGDRYIICDDVLAIMNAYPTYTELSPSGDGLHMYFIYHGDHEALPSSHHVLLPSGTGKIAVYRASDDIRDYLTVTCRAVTTAPLRTITADEVAYFNAYANHRPDATTPPEAPQTALADDTPPQTTPSATTPATATTKPATATTNTAATRLVAYMATAWPAVVKEACDKMANAPTGTCHPTRRRLGMTLGAQLRALELMYDHVGAAPVDIPDPQSIDDIISALYDAREPDGAEKTKTRQHATIVSAVKKGYDKTTTFDAWQKSLAPALKDILDAVTTPPVATKKPQTALADDTPPQTTPSATKPATATKKPQTATKPNDDDDEPPLVNFADIITPHKATISAMKDAIRQHGITPDMLYATAADIMATASQMPPPIIASRFDDAHLLMPGVCSLSAPSKSGKSTLALHLAYAVATGGNVFGSTRYQAQRGHTVYFDLENFAPVTGSRMEKMFTTPPPNHHHIDSGRWNTLLGVGAEQHVDRWGVMQWYITDALRRWPHTRLMILDNVIQFQPKTQRYETPRDAEERYLRWLVGVGDMYPNLCIMILDHNTKMQSTDKTDKDMLHDKQQGTFIKRALLSGGTLSMSKVQPSEDVPDGALWLTTSPRATAPLELVVKLDDTHGHHVLLDVKPLQLSAQQRRIYNTIQSGFNNPQSISDETKIPVDTVKKQLDRMIAKTPNPIYRKTHGVYEVSKPTDRYTPPQTTIETETF